MVPPIIYASVVKKNFNKSFSDVVDGSATVPPHCILSPSVKLSKLTVFKANEVSNPRIENLLAYASVRFYH